MLKQRPEPINFIFTWRTPKVVATIVFKKYKNSKWKKTKSLNELKIVLRGDIYQSYDCFTLFHTINTSRDRNKAKKLKIKSVGIPGTSQYFPADFHTKRQLPQAINADFIWRYNNNQVTIGKYGEVLKP